MKRFWSLSIILSAAIWMTGNGMFGLVAWQAFSNVLADQRQVAGDMVGAVLGIWIWIGLALGLVMTIACFLLALNNWRNLLRARAIGQVILAGIILLSHGAILTVNAVVHERRPAYQEAKQSNTPDETQVQAIQAFDQAHQLADQLFKGQSLFLALIMIVGTLLICRGGGDDN